MTDEAVLLLFVDVVPEHVPAADPDLQVAVFLGVSLGVAQGIGVEDVNT